MGMVVVAALATKCVGTHPLVTSTETRLRTNSAASSAQPIDLTFGPAVFDRHVLAVDIAGILEALAE